ncbi:hypothetical protein A3J41_02815 [candidate division TM6 bacterium RIFCSPHIGHO2_12_FULL_38_8]|nr:MAG: hypothetical protein A3J41_02815 [candidate division TM6 bacterium RIFCSPHIGHO2_12_FULL_38_8]
MLSILPFSYMHEFCADQLSLYTWQNYIEVCAFSYILYKILRWLQQDHTKHLILHVYAYAGIMILSGLTGCITLFWTMFIIMPVAMVACIIMHQKQLQKNFILASGKDLTPHSLPTKNWLDLFVRSCLLFAYQHKQFYCIIERSDHLAPLLQSPCNLYLALQQNIIDLVLSSTALHNPAILWLTDSGIINSVNVTWQPILTNEILTPQHQTTHHAEILLLTAKTDALVWSIDPTTKLAMLWHQGKSMHKLTIDQLLTSSKQILNQKKEHKNVHKQGVFNAAQDNSAHSSSKLH